MSYGVTLMFSMLQDAAASWTRASLVAGYALWGFDVASSAKAWTLSSNSRYEEGDMSMFGGGNGEGTKASYWRRSLPAWVVTGSVKPVGVRRSGVVMMSW